MKTRHYPWFTTVVYFAATLTLAANSSLEADETQLPRAMHTEMKDRAHVTVGSESGDIKGTDHRALQAAVDYVASLGGGTVEVGVGEFLMRDSACIPEVGHNVPW